MQLINRRAYDKGRYPTYQGGSTRRSSGAIGGLNPFFGKASGDIPFDYAGVPDNLKGQDPEIVGATPFQQPSGWERWWNPEGANAKLAANIQATQGVMARQEARDEWDRQRAAKNEDEIAKEGRVPENEKRLLQAKAEGEALGHQKALGIVAQGLVDSGLMTDTNQAMQFMHNAGLTNYLNKGVAASQNAVKESQEDYGNIPARVASKHQAELARDTASTSTANLVNEQNKSLIPNAGLAARAEQDAGLARSRLGSYRDTTTLGDPALAGSIHAGLLQPLFANDLTMANTQNVLQETARGKEMMGRPFETPIGMMVPQGSPYGHAQAFNLNIDPTNPLKKAVTVNTIPQISVVEKPKATPQAKMALDSKVPTALPEINLGLKSLDPFMQREIDGKPNILYPISAGISNSMDRILNNSAFKDSPLYRLLINK